MYEGKGGPLGAGGGMASRRRGGYRAYGRGGGARNSGVMPAVGCGGYRCVSCPSCPSWASASPGRLAEIIGRAVTNKIVALMICLCVNNFGTGNLYIGRYFHCHVLILSTEVLQFEDSSSAIDKIIVFFILLVARGFYAVSVSSPSVVIKLNVF